MLFRWILLVFWVSSIEGILAHSSYAVQAPAPVTIVMEQKLQAEEGRKNFLSQRLDAIHRIQEVSLTNQTLIQKLLKSVTQLVLILEAEQINIGFTLKAAQLELELTQSTIQGLQQRSIDIRRHLPISPEIEAIVQEQQKLLDLQQKRIRVLQQSYDMLSKTRIVTQDWCTRLRLTHKSNRQYQRESSLNQLLDKLNVIQDKWIQQLSKLNNQVNKESSVFNVLKHKDWYFSLGSMITEEKINLVHFQLTIATINDRLQHLSEALLHRPPLMILNTLQKPLESTLNQLQTIEGLLQQKITFLKNCVQAIETEPILGDISEGNEVENVVTFLQELAGRYQEQLTQLHTLTKQAQSEFYSFTQQLHAYLSNRQDLPGLNMNAWYNLGQRLTTIPSLFVSRIWSLLNLIITKIFQATWWQFSSTIILFLAWLRAWLWLRNFLSKKRIQLKSEAQEITSASLIHFMVQVIDRRLLSIMVFFGLWVLLLNWQVPVHTFIWLFNLISVWFVFRLILQGCRFWLIETGNEEERVQNFNLYCRLRNVLNIGCLITLMSLLVHQVVLDYEVRNFAARLFMLFLLVIALVLFRIWALVPKLLEGYWSKRPKYLTQVIRWVSFLLPMSVMLNAILGLIGYVQLAWAIVGYQGLLLLALAIYPIIKGLLNEIFNWLSEQSIRHFRNGWLWSEALLKPLYQALKLCILFIIIFSLLNFIGYREQFFSFDLSPSIWLYQPLFAISEIPITISKIIKVVLMIIFIIWLLRWMREFAYRWIFANLKDLGLRTSLSIFTQYMAISVNILITLQIAGLTLSVLKYVLSGFAIGLSFGLRDLFNNFVTGILLLVERPLKIGDWVTIGNFDGQVTHIGARSITINTEDHQALMVPNADLFYKHFVNWTRHDNIVRIKLPISVHRNDDPREVRNLILEVIDSIPQILKHPAPEVHFQSTDQLLFAFKVEYYVDLTQITSRSAVKTQFLFALWKRFSEANISPPEIVQELYINGKLGLESPATITTTQDA